MFVGTISPWRVLMGAPDLDPARYCLPRGEHGDGTEGRRREPRAGAPQGVAGPGVGKQTRVDAAQAQSSGPTAATSGAPAPPNRQGHLAELLATPSPPIGDPLVAYLLGLPLPALLDELAEAVACGYALPLEARLAVAPALLPTALQVAELAQYDRLTPGHPVLARVGAALDTVSLDQQVRILGWLLNRRGVSIQATNLLEGAIAIRQEEQDDAGDAGSASTAVGAQTTTGGMPSPIEPGPWEPPGDQPAGYYIGSDVHRRSATTTLRPMPARRSR